MVLDQKLGQDAIRVLVADSTRIHTQLLSDALRRDRRLEVIGPGSHSRDLTDAVSNNKIDIVVLASNLDEELVADSKCCASFVTPIPIRGQ